MGKLTMYGRPRDNQRSKVYKWERMYLPNGERLTPKEIKSLAADVYLTYGYPNGMPDIIVTRAKTSWSHYHPIEHQIRLAAGWGQDTRIVLHEVAHALVHTMGIGKKIAWHGPEFVGLLMELFELWLPGEILIAKIEGEKIGTYHQTNYD